MTSVAGPIVAHAIRTASVRGISSDHAGGRVGVKYEGELVGDDGRDPDRKWGEQLVMDRELSESSRGTGCHVGAGEAGYAG